MPPETVSRFIPYGRQSVDDEDVRAVTEVLRDPMITQGSRIEAFEQALCETTGARFAVAVANGTAALHAAYAAVGLGPGHEVITTANTFLATANAAVFVGAKPVLVDIESTHHNIAPDRVASRITAKTRAIVAVDYAGHPAEMDALRKISEANDLALVEDASHSLGAEYRGRSAGTLADVTTLSFHPVKGITTGEGGAVLTDDPRTAEFCRRFRSHGIERDRRKLSRDDGPWYFEMTELGYNYRITDFQCALGISQLQKLDRFVARRRDLAARYDRLLAPLGEVRPPAVAQHVSSAWHLYPILVPAEKRRQIFEMLREAGIGVQVHYIPVYRHPYYQERLGVEYSDYPETEDFYARAISLPLHPALTERDQDRVVEQLGIALGRVRP